MQAPSLPFTSAHMLRDERVTAIRSEISGAVGIRLEECGVELWRHCLDVFSLAIPTRSTYRASLDLKGRNIIVCISIPTERKRFFSTFGGYCRMGCQAHPPKLAISVPGYMANFEKFKAKALITSIS